MTIKCYLFKLVQNTLRSCIIFIFNQKQYFTSYPRFVRLFRTSDYHSIFSNLKFYAPSTIVFPQASQPLGRDNRYPLPLPVIVAQNIRFYSYRGCVQKRQFRYGTLHFSLHALVRVKVWISFPVRKKLKEHKQLVNHLLRNRRAETTSGAAKQTRLDEDIYIIQHHI